MNSKIRTLSKTILRSLIFCLLAGCGKPLEQSVIGTWQDKDHPSEYTVFRADHTVELISSGGSVSGKWDKISNDELRIDLIFKFLRLEGIKISSHTMKFESDGIKTTLLRKE